MEKADRNHILYNQFTEENLSKADLLQSSSRKLPLRRTPHHTDTDQHVIPLHWQTIYNELPVRDYKKKSTFQETVI